ncbi:YbaB/EbfC family nucleoid-associated protein [Microbacterium sp. GXF7504]
MTWDGEALASLEAARARVLAQTERARAAAADAERLAEDVRALTTTARSPRGEVSVTAAADGGIERIEVAEGAYDLDAASLGRLLTETIRRAQQAAADAALARMGETLGEDSPLVQGVRAELASRRRPATGLG